jgi:hypothetical protein
MSINQKFRSFLGTSNETSMEACNFTPLQYTFLQVQWVNRKGGQTAILVRWSAAQRTTEMLADWKK